MTQAKKKKPAITAGRPSVRKAAQGRNGMADKADTVRVNFDLDRAAHTRLKVHAARTGQSVAEVLRELVAAIGD